MNTTHTETYLLSQARPCPQVAIQLVHTVLYKTIIIPVQYNYVHVQVHVHVLYIIVFKMHVHVHTCMYACS